NGHMGAVHDKADERMGERKTVPDGTCRTSALAKQLNLPEEVTAQAASEILGVSKHTVLRFLEDGLLEWRDAAPPSSARPVYRITLRSVLELRLGYRVGSATRQEKDKIRPRRRTAEAGAYQVQHLRRKGSKTQE